MTTETYIIVEGNDSLGNFNKEVQKCLEAGWRLQGGVSIAATDRSHTIIYYAQAMVK